MITFTEIPQESFIYFNISWIFMVLTIRFWLGKTNEQNGKLAVTHSVDINSEILKEIIEWCKYHKRCTPEKDNKRDGKRASWELCEWDRGFFLENRQKFGELVDAAILLDMEHLCDACSIYVTERFKEYKESGESPRYCNSS